MASLIEQLQSEALDQSVSVSNLLQKAKVVAYKLNLKEFHEWVENELNGYKEDQEPPVYRKLQGELKGWNPFHGWQFVMMSSTEEQEMVSTVWNRQSIASLEELYDSKAGYLCVMLPTDLKKNLIEGIGFQTEIQIHLDKTQITNVLSTVRNAVLDWSLKLEKAGIKGEGMGFKEQEKKKADEAKTTFKIDKIENFIGNVGNVAGRASQSFAQINNAVDIEGFKTIIKQIKDNINLIGLDTEKKEAIIKDTDRLEKELSVSKPQFSKIENLRLSIKNILEEASGNLVASGILYGLSKLANSN